MLQVSPVTLRDGEPYNLGAEDSKLCRSQIIVDCSIAYWPFQVIRVTFSIRFLSKRSRALATFSIKLCTPVDALRQGRISSTQIRLVNLN